MILMKAVQIQVGQSYTAKVSGRVVPVLVLSKEESFSTGKSRTIWHCRNEKTGREIVIRSAQRFRNLVVEKPEIKKVDGYYIGDNGKAICPGVVCRCEEQNVRCPMHG